MDREKLNKINNKILAFITYPKLFTQLEKFKKLKDEEKEGKAAKDLLDLPCILYIINTVEYEENEEKLLLSKNLRKDVKKFINKNCPRINAFYDGGLYSFLGENKIYERDKLSTNLTKSSGYTLEKRRSQESGKEYLLFTKIIHPTDSPKELHPNPHERRDLLGDVDNTFFIPNKNASKTISATKRLLLYILKKKVKLKDDEIAEWFGSYGFPDYPNYEDISREISRFHKIFK